MNDVNWGDWRSVIDYIDGNGLSERLDELVHELASHQASEANNCGAEGQIEFITSRLGNEVARKEIKKILESE